MPTPPGRLRPFELARDLDFFLASLGDTYETNFPGFSATRPFREEMRASLIERLGDGTMLALAWECGGATAAYICLGLRGGQPEPYGVVENVYVAADWRGRGIGRALLLAAEDRLRGIGCSHLLLEVSTVNEAAVGLYRRMGYRTTRLQMEKPLRPGLRGVGRKPYVPPA
jgi:ribosomal protein S18 acetylase RimI-like enzyme